jgi:hypothetical protein
LGYRYCWSVQFRLLALDFEMRPPKIITIIVLAGLVVTTPAYAYIDPNSGGLIFQILTPILALATAGIAFTGRTIRRGCGTLYRALKNRLGRIVRTPSRDLD